MYEPEIDDRWIRSLRGKKNKVSPHRPYFFLIEEERMPDGTVTEVGTIFLTNKECPFTCLMCDLWKNTLDEKVPPGLIPEQIRFALREMNGIKNIKLYNSGNFFDQQAVPEEDYQSVAHILSGCHSVIVESHPKLINESCLPFRDMLDAELQVAIGLETAHPQVLKKLNKKMSLQDFERSVSFLVKNNIRSRAFILLRPPMMTEEEGVVWAKKSIDFAFDTGVECCVIIPTRSGNGATDWLAKKNLFTQPSMYSLEEVTEYGISLERGRVFADLWDLDRFSTCQACFDERKNRLTRMNHRQIIPSPVQCHCLN